MAHISKIGKYDIVDVLGEGAMGVVYRAVDPVLGREVAIKVMNDALARDEDFRTRFLHEARAAGSLQHPNVITVYDCGEVDGHLYIGMELVKGADLEQLMGDSTPLTTTNKIEIIIGVLTALSYAHKRGIVHRDIKPANIRVNEEGRALIMDFGIAHIQSSNMTKTGMMVGTPNYMAPEQVLGGAITAQTDIFAVGAVLYELLTNLRPFEGENMHSVLYKIVSEPPEPPEKIVTGLRPDLAAICMRALAKEPADRYENALEMAGALTKALAAMSNAPTVARTMSLRASIETARQKDEEERAVERQAAVHRTRNTRVAIASAGVVLAGALAAAVVVMRKPPVPETASSVGAVPPAASQAGAPNGATTRAAALPTALAAPPAGTSASPTPAPAPAVTDARPTQQKPEQQADAGVLRALEAAATQARRKAVDAGATGPQLETGDAYRRSADKLRSAGKSAEAARTVNQAIVAWGEAESAARVATVTAANVTASQQAAHETPARQQSVVTTPPVVGAAPPAVTAPAANPTRDISVLVTDYGRAIDSRDVAQLRHLYPEMTAQQVSAFEDFFKSVRSIKASLSMSNLQVDGASAEGTLTGAYDFVTGNGRDQHQPVTMRATMRRDGTGWHFTSIR